MSLDALRNMLPEYAKDLKLNLGSLAAETLLTEQQLAGTFIASALASRNIVVTKNIVAEFGPKLSAEALNAAKASAAIMGMNNVYYRSLHLLSNGEYKTLPAKLRMNILANPGVDKVDFELWSTAVSAVNGCGMCIESHEQEVLKKGATKEGVQDVIRIASVIHAVAVALEGERVLAG